MSDAARRDLTEEVLAAEQDERRRIALFLHDGPVQSLSGVALMLDAVGELIARSRNDEAAEVLDRALARTRSTIGELRNLSFNLEPVSLRDQGLSTAVKALGETRGIEHEIQMTIDVDAAEALGQRAQAALYEIVREALEGSIRRGPPKSFSVKIVPVDPQQLEMTIRDDAPSERRRTSIEVLEERARSLRAAVTVEHDEEGSTLRFVVPVYAASE